MINFSKRKEFRLEQKDKLPTAFLTLGGCFVLLTIFNFKLVLDSHAVMKNSQNSLIQMSDGSSVIASRSESKYYRSPESIKSFLGNWLKLHYTFSGSITQIDGSVIPDEGADLNLGKTIVKVPLNTYNSSFAIVPEARNPSLAVVASKWVDSSYFSGVSTTTTEVIIDEIGEPQEIKRRGKKKAWEVPLIAKVIYHSPNGGQKIKYFRRKFIVLSIDFPSSPPQKSASIHERLTYEWSKSGLQIIGINYYE